MATSVKAVYNAEIVPGGFLYDQAFADIASDVVAINNAAVTLGSGVLDVGSADSDGTASTASRVNHIHRGVHKINKSADAYGDLSFSGPGVSQSGNVFTFPGGTFGTVRLASADFTFGTSGEGVVIATGGGSFNGSLPLASSVTAGSGFWLWNDGATVQILLSGSDTGYGIPRLTLNHETTLLISDGVSYWWAVGPL